jgi:hypothetical protein
MERFRQREETGGLTPPARRFVLMELAVPDTFSPLVGLETLEPPVPLMSLLFRYFLWLLLPWVLGCHNPARQNVPNVDMGQREAELRKELVPGRRAERALGYLLTQDFDVRVTRDESANVERIVATGRNILRDGNGKGRRWHVDLAIENNTVQSAKINPL